MLPTMDFYLTQTFTVISKFRKVVGYKRKGLIKEKPRGERHKWMLHADFFVKKRLFCKNRYSSVKQRYESED